MAAAPGKTKSPGKWWRVVGDKVGDKVSPALRASGDKLAGVAAATGDKLAGVAAATSTMFMKGYVVGASSAARFQEVAAPSTPAESAPASLNRPSVPAPADATAQQGMVDPALVIFFVTILLGGGLLALLYFSDDLSKRATRRAAAAPTKKGTSIAEDAREEADAVTRRMVEQNYVKVNSDRAVDAEFEFIGKPTLATIAAGPVSHPGRM